MSPLEGPKAPLGPYPHCHSGTDRGTIAGSPKAPESPLLDRVGELERKFQEAIHSLSKSMEELAFRIIELERKVG